MFLCLLRHLKWQPVIVGSEEEPEGKDLRALGYDPPTPADASPWAEQERPTCHAGTWGGYKRPWQSDGCFG